MAHIDASDAKAWAESTKLNVESIESSLESQVASEVLARLSGSFDISTWVDASSTPLLIKRIISMRYISWYIQRAFAEDSDLSPYAVLLMEQSNILMVDIIAGTIVVPEIPTTGDKGLNGPGFYPTDASSALEPTDYDSSLGGPKFSMGRSF